ARLTFSSVAFYLDKGIKHIRHKQKKAATTYTPNATAHHVPVTVGLSLAATKAGKHTVKVVFSYKQAKRKHGHRRTVTVTKRLTDEVAVC
ncbi:MAG TPA: hypothetical protein VG186_06695, partial [Solirubrobacteraceae bacterium]|nr:hypothetical protein [Solirubrobacteraceae bacterium]